MGKDETNNTGAMRMRKLLAYASICFKHGTSPFETMHLSKLNVKSFECVDLGDKISDIIADAVLQHDLDEAEILFQETQV